MNPRINEKAGDAVYPTTDFGDVFIEWMERPKVDYEHRGHGKFRVTDKESGLILISWTTPDGTDHYGEVIPEVSVDSEVEGPFETGLYGYATGIEEGYEVADDLESTHIGPLPDKIRDMVEDFIQRLPGA